MQRRVLITREEAEPLAEMLMTMGMTPVHVPLVELFATGETAPAGSPDVVFVTSRAVARFVPDLAQQIGSAAVYAVGQRTATALEQRGVQVTKVGSGGGHALLSSVSLQAGQRVWYVGAAQPSGTLLAGLDALPCSVQRWSVYDNRCPAKVSDELRAVLPVDAVTFTSGTAVARFCERGKVGAAKVVVIGDTTAREVSAHGLPVAGCPPVPSLQAMASVVHDLLVDEGP